MTSATYYISKISGNDTLYYVGSVHKDDSLNWTSDTSRAFSFSKAQYAQRDMDAIAHVSDYFKGCKVAKVAPKMTQDEIEDLAFEIEREHYSRHDY